MVDSDADRFERERSFHDARFAADERPADRFYAIAGATDEDYRRRAFRDGSGRRVLEYGCGPGGLAFDLAAAGCDVLGIDISPVAIEVAAAKADRCGMTGLDFAEMNAESLELEDASFDLVCGSGILHHLDIAVALGEVARVLKPDGRAVFVEPLGHNPAINLYRRLTPGMRTDDEHPLVRSDVTMFSDRFGQVDLAFFQLATLLAVPFASRPWAQRPVAALDRVDSWLFRTVRPLRWQAWTTVIELSAPR